MTAELVEGEAEVKQKAETVKDPTIKAVIKNFTDIGVSALEEIEDVLLAQGQGKNGGVSDFFRVQDLVEGVREALDKGVMPKTRALKIQLMRYLSDLYF